MRYSIRVMQMFIWSTCKRNYKCTRRRRRRQHKAHKHTSITRKSDYNDNNMHCWKIARKNPSLSPFITLSQHRHKQKHMPHCAHWDSFESLETKHRNGNECFSFWVSRKCILKLIWTTATMQHWNCVQVCVFMFVCCIHIWKRLQIHGISAKSG